jgi:hypothetical protein
VSRSPRRSGTATTGIGYTAITGVNGAATTGVDDTSTTRATYIAVLQQ